MNRRRVLQIVSAILIITITIGGYTLFSLFNKANVALAGVTKAGSDTKLTDLLKPMALDGEETGRVNILIAGNSVDDPGHSGSALTDSILVASIDVTTKKLTLISVARDLWVDHNGSTMKINAVYTQGGMNALKEQIEDVLGITLNHQVLINYSAFRNMIDAVGGVDVTIDSSDPRGIYDPMIGFEIGNGVQHMNGTQALLLARSRNDPTNDGRIAYGLPNGDFDRQMYQRKILQALLDKLTSVTTFINPTTLPDIIESFGGDVTTNLTAGQLRRLYDLSKEISTTDSISTRGDEGNLLLADYISDSGQSVLMPSAGINNYTAIQQYVASYLTVRQSTTTE